MLLFCILVAYGISYYQRYASYSYWMENRDSYVVGEVVAMSGNDSYYWLKMARELDAGTIGRHQPEPTKAYPDGGLLAFKDTPSLLAEMISFGKNFTGGNYYHAGLLLIPLLAGLFIFPLFFYFNSLGLGSAAIFGGLFGAFSEAYYARTKMGRIDTDLLNLFFPLAIACFILPLHKERKWLANLGLAAGAGLMMQLYMRWYQQASMIVVYFCVLLVYLLVSRLPWKQFGPILVVFLLCSGPEYLLQTSQSLNIFLQAYFSPPPTGSIAWPNILQTVGEAQVRGALVTLKKLHPFLPLVGIGFVGLAYLAIRHFRQMIPLAPLLALGAWSLIGPNRFAMYLAPLVGIGVGVLLKLAVDYLWHKKNYSPNFVPLASASLMFVLFFAATAFSGFPKPPAPALNAPITRALVELKRIIPQHSAIFTPYWEYGYPLMEIDDFASYHDGGTQGGMRSTLSAIATASADQRDMVSLLAYLEDHGFNELAAKIRDEKLDARQMLQLVFNYPQAFNGENVYVLYLEQMIWKVYSMTKIGSWDFSERKSQPTDYVELHCFSLQGNVMQCSDGTIDLERGFMNDGSVDIPMRGALFVDNGYVTSERYYPHDSGYYLQVLMKDGKAFMTLVADGPLFRSNFNQQYLLGKYDRRYFEEVYNDYPIARVFKVKNNATDQSTESR